MTVHAQNMEDQPKEEYRLCSFQIFLRAKEKTEDFNESMQ